MKMVGLLLAALLLGLIGLGFGLGWYVRGAYVRRYLREQLRKRGRVIKSVDPENKSKL